MTRSVMLICLVLGIGLAAKAGQNEPEKSGGLKLLLSEVQPGAMASEQHCMLVFTDRRFHAEKAAWKLGNDRERIVYEGQISEVDWNRLTEILERKEFRELNVPRSIQIVLEDAHPYAISVAREKGYQNMEFLNKESLKPYKSQLKPLLQWWKSVRRVKMPASQAPADSRCSRDSDQPILNR